MIPANIPPPEVLMLPIILCHSCGHGIDPHGLDPGGYCGVGDRDGVLCDCLWSPNDIAAKWRRDFRAEVAGLWDTMPEGWSRPNQGDGYILGYRQVINDVLALLDGSSG